MFKQKPLLMNNYIDAFVLPIPTRHIDEYQEVVKRIAEIWIEHGALAYYEFQGDDLKREGLRSFPEMINTDPNESVIFGWTVFESKEMRDIVNQKVVNDPRMTALVDPLIDPDDLVFDAGRMVYGGFKILAGKG